MVKSLSIQNKWDNHKNTQLINAYLAYNKVKHKQKKITITPITKLTVCLPNDTWSTFVLQGRFPRI